MKVRTLGVVAIGALLAACGTDAPLRAGNTVVTTPSASAATDQRDANIGRLAANESNAAMNTPGNTRDLQRALSQRGFNAGPADGVYGPRTRRAVMDWQRANNQQVTGRATPQLWSQINQPVNVGAAGMRDAAGHAMGGVSNSGSESAGSNNRVPTGTSGLNTASGPGVRDAAGNPMGGVSNSGSESMSSGDRRPTGTSAQGGGIGGPVRPNPTASTPPGPGGGLSNNPMNDPVGGSAQSTTTGLNRN